MCDYSIHNAVTRPAKIGDKLETYQFGVTTGFAAQGEIAKYGEDETPGCHNGRVAVCLRPGTEIAFDEPVAVNGFYSNGSDYTSHVPFEQTEHRTAIFRQVDLDNPNRHHDCLEFPNGKAIFLTNLTARQTATVLQLPAEAKPERPEPEKCIEEMVRDIDAMAVRLIKARLDPERARKLLEGINS